jgi:hypothetical protein
LPHSWQRQRPIGAPDYSSTSCASKRLMCWLYLGLDSLMAVELRNLLSSAVGNVPLIPATLVFDYPTIEAISGFLADEILGGFDASDQVPANVSASSESIHGALVSSLLDDLENLSDDEIDAQLARRGGS